MLETELAKSARVKAAEATSRKVSGLTVSTRESFLNLFLDDLRKNFQMVKEKRNSVPVKALSEQDILQCAIALEYDSFSANKVASMYRRACAFKVSVTCTLYSSMARNVNVCSGSLVGQN